VKRSSKARILTTHAGSLPRPSWLDDAVERRDESQSEYSATLRRAVAEVVHQQAAAGVDVVNDGEFGKSSWTGYATARLGGFEARPAERGGMSALQGGDRRAFSDFYDEAAREGKLWYRPDGRLRTPPPAVHWVCTGPITYTGHAAVRQDIHNLKAALQGEDVQEAFLPVAAPASVEPGRGNEYYPSEEAYVHALAEALKVEYDAIHAAGFVLQIDDAFIPALWDRMQDTLGLDKYRAFCAMRIEALNHALRDIPEDRVRYHICRGSWHGPHSTDIPLRDIVDLVLKVKAQAYSIEAANVRHEHEYHVWEDVKLPEGKILIPGVVSHATNVLEHPELVAERLRRYCERVGHENVIGGTDCGLGGRVHPQLAWAKLRVLAEGAALASGASA
jgi:5-methyltetrahydropteroyltriglutamate--homocysteine methyltransferase